LHLRVDPLPGNTPEAAAKDDAASVLYTETPDVGTVMAYIASHS
jgi:hypothetical protein